VSLQQDLVVSKAWIGLLIEPGPRHSPADGVLGSPRHEAEASQSGTDVRVDRQRVGVVDAELEEARDPAVVQAGITDPEPLASEGIDPAGPVLLDTVGGGQLARLSPSPDGHGAGHPE